MITGINESRTLAKQCQCKCKFNDRNCNSYQNLNIDNRLCECKKHHICEKDYIWNPATCSFKNSKYLTSIIDNLVTACDEMLETTETIQINSNEKSNL